MKKQTSKVLRQTAGALIGVLCGVHAGFAGAQQVLTKDALQPILSGATISSTMASGTDRRWVNEPDGTLVATAYVHKKMKMYMTKTYTHPGDWHISDDGKYCVHIEWQQWTERWCAAVQQVGDGQYAFVGDASANLPPTLEIRR
ncbi:hypothetical protein [Burkholderia anthina]|uniref:hypothetical protein n=1 Tax=Burkholderia anthina TaxID=179879 RepID=UPI00158DD551|nr:hypothetical protein [Burkholderia anthina]